jgi:hypothetical protein
MNRRREFLTLLGGAVVRPIQVVGFLNARMAESCQHLVAAFPARFGTRRLGVIYDTANLGRGHLPAIQSALSPGMRLVP